MEQKPRNHHSCAASVGLTIATVLTPRYLIPVVPIESGSRAHECPRARPGFVIVPEVHEFIHTFVEDTLRYHRIAP